MILENVLGVCIKISCFIADLPLSLLYLLLLNFPYFKREEFQVQQILHLLYIFHKLLQPSLSMLCSLGCVALENS